MGTSHRRDPVRSLVARLRQGVADLFGLPDGYQVVVSNGGASYFWDVCIFSLIDRRSEHLAFGEFSGRFASLVAEAPHLDAPMVIEAAPGSHPWVERRSDVDLYALTHNETSTGVMMEIERPGTTFDPAVVAVDATSAAGGIRFDPLQVDAYYFSPQKCFASDGGMWVAVLSERAVERARRMSSQRYIPASLDLSGAIDQSANDQTRNTPAIATLLLFLHQLDWLLMNGGMDFAERRVRLSSSILYDWAEASMVAWPFVGDPTMRSQVVATIDFDSSVDAGRISAVLRANGVVDTEPYRKLGRNQLRIATYPAIDPGDVEAVTRCIDYVVGQLS